MEKKVFLLIQGHTNFCSEVIENVKNLKNVIWSTDSDSNSECLSKIKESNIILIESDKPNPGYGNINLQLSTTLSGILKAEELGATHIIKTRSDLLFSNPKKFIDEYDFDERLHFLSYISHGPWADKNIVEIYPDLPSWIENMGYNSIISNISDYNYIADFSNLGPISEMKLFWSYPNETDYIRIPAEFKLVLNYLKNKGLNNIDFSLNEIKKIFSFYISYLKHTGNPMISLKRGWNTNELFDGPRGDGSWSGWKG